MTSDGRAQDIQLHHNGEERIVGRCLFYIPTVSGEFPIHVKYLSVYVHSHQLISGCHDGVMLRLMNE